MQANTLSLFALNLKKILHPTFYFEELSCLRFLNKTPMRSI